MVAKLAYEKPKQGRRNIDKAAWAADFSARVENASRVLQSHGIDTSITVKDAIDIFTRSNHFEDDGDKNSRFMCHEVAHPSGCATSGTPADEARTMFFETAYMKGGYLAKNFANKSLYGTAEDFEHAEPAALFQKIKDNIHIRIKSGVSYYEEKIKKYQSLLEEISKEKSGFLGWKKLLHLNRKKALKAEIARLQNINKDNTLNDEEFEPLFHRALEQDEFFQTITNGRPLYALSTAELGQLPIAFLGVEFNKAANDNSELFTHIPSEKLKKMAEEIKASAPTMDLAA